MRIPPDKLAHAGQSFLFTFVLSLIAQHWGWPALIAFAIGLGRELLQHSGARIQRQFPYTRRFAFLRGAGEYSDLVANGVGIALAVLALDLVGVPR